MVVLVALLMLPIVMLLGLSVQIGNWFVHKRHLQTQVDAAALAAGQHFADCLTNPGSTVQASMESIAGVYGGNTYNRQVGGSTGRGTVTLSYQHNAYPSPSEAAPDTDVAEGKDPCAGAMFDVKAVEGGIPHIFNIGPLVNVSAHARVELKLLTEMKGLLPVAVPDTRFDYAWATFVNEATGAVIAGPVAMSKAGTNAKGQQLWNTTTPPSVSISARDIGVKIRLVAGPNPNLTCGSLYTECYPDPTSNHGIVHIRGWSAGGGPLAPVELHNVWMLPGNCDPSSYFTMINCSAGIQAEVDFGDRPISGTGITASVTATVAGGATVDLTAGGVVSGTTRVWNAAGGLGVIGPDEHPITMRFAWEQTTGSWRGLTCNDHGNNPCKGSGVFEGGGTIQRPYEGSPDLTGPVQQVDIFESGVSTSGANSFQQGSSHTLGVTLATAGTLKTQSAATDPVIYLRVAGGSLNQSIDCDPALSNVRDEIREGCSPAYTLNTDLTCPAYNELWGTPQPWDCVKTQTGGAVGQVEQGLKDRILGGSNSCTAPINWPNYGPDDKRIVPLIVTPFGSFSGSGNDIVPVIDFGAFYVVGWDGDPCPGAVPVPKKGFVAGHFIKYIPRNPKGSGDAACFLTDPTKLTPCAAVLTR